MEIMLISGACAIFILGSACAREVTSSPTFILHSASIVAARRVAQLSSASRASCATTYVTTIESEASNTTRKSVDCNE